MNEIAVIMQDYEKYADSLKAMGNTSNASLVQNKTKIENTSYTAVTPNKLKAAEQIYEEIRSDVQKMNEKLKKLLKENGRSIQKKPVPTPRPRMGDGQGTVFTLIYMYVLKAIVR